MPSLLRQHNLRQARGTLGSEREAASQQPGPIGETWTVRRAQRESAERDDGQSLRPLSPARLS